jgi:predicted nucleic acid-binding protein
MAENLIVLDSGALSQLAERNGAVRRALRKAAADGVTVLVPTAVIAEATTGDHRRDANVNRELKRTTLIALNEPIARAAASLRHAHRRVASGTIDAIVVATADAVPGTRVLTGDPVDLSLLASVRNRTRVVPLTELESG